MELLRLAKAARRLGIHPATLRIWADEGRVPVTWVGRERRFSSVDVDSLKTSHGKPGAEGRRRLVVLYVRVSGSGGQEASLAAQEREQRDTAAGEVARVFRDRASALRENRPGLTRLLAAVADGDLNVVRVTREGRLARFGAGWLRQLMAARGASPEVLHPKSRAGWRS